MLPLYVNVSGKRIIVFGGGAVAERKIRQILDTGSDEEVNVEVYSLDFTPHIEDMGEKGEIDCFRCDLWGRDLGEITKGAFLTLICTDDDALNNRILKEMEKSDALVNYGNEGDAFMSSVVKKGGFLISISTTGKAPAMAKHMREKISSIIGEKEEKMLHIQSHLRRRLKEKIRDENRRREVLNLVLSDPECWTVLDEPFEVAEKLVFKIVDNKYA